MITDRSKEASGFFRFLEFFLTRFLGTFTDCAVLWILADFVFKGSYFGKNILSPSISFEAATLVNYITSYFWIWHTRINDPGHKSFWQKFVSFNISALMGYVIKMVLLLLFDHWFGWHVVICNLIALSVAGIYNYFIAEKWVFKRKIPAREEEE